MRLAKLSAFRRMIFTPGSAPAARELRAQIDRAEIPGGLKMAGLYYVDLDAFDEAMGLRRDNDREITALKKDPRLAGLI